MNVNKMLMALSFLLLSCTNTNEKLTQSHEGECAEKTLISSMEVPTPITLSDKKREVSKGGILSGNLLKERMKKFQFYDLFYGDDKYNGRIEEDGFGYLSYRSKENKNFIRVSIDGGFGLGSGRGNNFSLRHIDYDFDDLTTSDSEKILSEQERKELIALANIVTDNPLKSKQIVSELENIYKEKMDKKQVLVGSIIAANMVYQDSLFELRGIYHADAQRSPCGINSLHRFSID